MWVWGMGEVARTFHRVVGPLAKLVRVVGVEAVCDGEAEDGGADETVFVGYGCPDGGWGFVAIWGCAGGVGWVVGRGVIPEKVARGRDHLSAWVLKSLARIVGILSSNSWSVRYLRVVSRGRGVGVPGDLDLGGGGGLYTLMRRTSISSSSTISTTTKLGVDRGWVSWFQT